MSLPSSTERSVAPVHFASALAPLALLAALGCSDMPATSTSVTTTVGPEGGTLSVPGLTVTVPPGALEEATELTARAVPGAPDHVSARFDSLATYELEPSGLTFARPVEIAVTVETSRMPTSRRAGLFSTARFDRGFERLGARWEPSGANTILRGYTRHFSFVFAGEARPVRPSFGAGADTPLPPAAPNHVVAMRLPPEQGGGVVCIATDADGRRAFAPRSDPRMSPSTDSREAFTLDFEVGPAGTVAGRPICLEARDAEEATMFVIVGSNLLTGAIDNAVPTSASTVDLTFPGVPAGAVTPTGVVGAYDGRGHRIVGIIGSMGGTATDTTSVIATFDVDETPWRPLGGTEVLSSSGAALEGDQVRLDDIDRDGDLDLIHAAPDGSELRLAIMEANAVVLRTSMPLATGLVETRCALPGGPFAPFSNVDDNVDERAPTPMDVSAGKPERVVPFIIRDEADFARIWFGALGSRWSEEDAEQRVRERGRWAYRTMATAAPTRTPAVGLELPESLDPAWVSPDFGATYDATTGMISPVSFPDILPDLPLTDAADAVWYVDHDGIVRALVLLPDALRSYVGSLEPSPPPMDAGLDARVGDAGPIEVGTTDGGGRITFASDRTTIDPGDDFTLTWSAPAASGCELGTAGSGRSPVATTGTRPTNLTRTATFELVCFFGVESETAMLTVTVDETPRILSFGTLDGTVPLIYDGLGHGQLVYDVIGAVSCSISPGIGMVIDGTDGRNRHRSAGTPLTAASRTTYTLSCDGLPPATTDLDIDRTFRIERFAGSYQVRPADSVRVILDLPNLPGLDATCSFTLPAGVLAETSFNRRLTASSLTRRPIVNQSTGSMYTSDAILTVTCTDPTYGSDSAVWAVHPPPSEVLIQEIDAPGWVEGHELFTIALRVANAAAPCTFDPPPMESTATSATYPGQSSATQTYAIACPGPSGGSATLDWIIHRY